MFHISNSSSPRKADALVLRFPPRGRYRFDIRVEPESDGRGWLVLAPDGNGWAHGCWSAAIDDAREIGRVYGTGIQSSAGRWTP